MSAASIFCPSMLAVYFRACCITRFDNLSLIDISYSQVAVILKLKRKTLYYVMGMVMPALLFSLLVLLVYRLPPSPPAKISMGMTILLSYSVLSLMINDNIPNTSTQFPLIGKDNSDFHGSQLTLLHI